MSTKNGAQLIRIKPLANMFSVSEELFFNFWNIFLFAYNTDGKQTKLTGKLKVKRPCNGSNNMIENPVQKIIRYKKRGVILVSEVISAFNKWYTTIRQ